MRRFFLLNLICLALTSCSLLNSSMGIGTGESVTTSSNSKSTKDKWTILIYMAADNNLESEAIEDIWEMETSKLNCKNTNILFLLDRSPSYDISNGNWSGTKMFSLKTGRSNNSRTMISTEINCEELGLVAGKENELDLSDTYVLANAVSFMMNNFKSNHYGLIMWGHGTGWRGSEEKIEKNKGFAFDSTSGTYMSLQQMKNGIKSGLQDKKLDFIGFDTCFGGEVEVFYELKDLALYGIGSPGLLVSSGWNYTTLLNDFTAKSQKGVLDFCDSAVYQFQKEYAHKNGASITVVDLSKTQEYFENFENFMELATECVDSPITRDEIINDIFTNCLTYTEGTTGSDVYIDINSLVEMTGNHLDLIDEKNDFLIRSNEFVVKGWANDTEKPGPGIYFASIAESGLFAAKHPSGYIKGASSEQIDFVRDSKWYVPCKEKRGSFIDKLFYTTNW